jgi:hypothetical protein
MDSLVAAATAAGELAATAGAVDVGRAAGAGDAALTGATSAHGGAVGGARPFKAGSTQGARSAAAGAGAASALDKSQQALDYFERWGRWATSAMDLLNGAAVADGRT